MLARTTTSGAAAALPLPGTVSASNPQISGDHGSNSYQTESDTCVGDTDPCPFVLYHYLNM